MGIESLKEQARRHEQKEEWLKALDQYKKAISALEAADRPDIGLYNRVGDLFVRVGRLDDAVEHYEKAVDLYLESELANNAIAVCKKIIRNVPERSEAYLRMGQIRARQGFLPDARSNFLRYAERMQQAGELDESFRALIEFCDLAPTDVELRVAVADQMLSHERADEAVVQLSEAYRSLMHAGEVDEAAVLEAKIRELDPAADLSGAGGRGGPDLREATRAGDEVGGGFGEIEIGGAIPTDPASSDMEAGEPVTSEEADGFEVEHSGSFSGAGFEDADALTDAPFGSTDEAEAVVSDEAGELPTFDPPAEDADELPSFDIPEELEAEVIGAGGGGLDDIVTSEEEDTEDVIGDELPLVAFDAEDDDIEGPTDLPLFGLEDEEEGEGAAVSGPDSGEGYEVGPDSGGMEEVEVELADIGFSSEAAREEAVEEAAGDRSLTPAEEEPATLEGLRARIEAEPDDVALRQRLVEVAYQSGDEGALVEAYLGLGESLTRAGESSKAKAAFQQALHIDPSNRQAQAALGDASDTKRPVREVASHEDYVDLGALVLGEGDEKTTRFVVAYEEPSGDEQADFAKMLSQFKNKVSANLGSDDVKAHYDLGTAYKEMGLLDEAVSEFQQALRASGVHLPTYEMLGQTFIEMGKTDAAIRSLERALEIDHDIEDELIGIYYYLARAYESVGNKAQALEFYDRVFALDINFADVTERLRALR